MKKVLSLVSGSVLAIAIAVVPTEKVEAGYGMAGCGLGSMIIKDNTMVMQVLAATTNASSYSQMFGITTGTSECTDSGVIKAQVEQKIYAFQNFETLKKEMAQGEGEKLNSFAMLMGCSADTVPEFGTMTRSNYDAIFDGEVTSDVMVQRVREVAVQNSDVAAGCSRI